MSAETKVIEHRGRSLQIHVAPWADDPPDKPAHVHVQDLEGGAGEIVHFDSARARQLARNHPELEQLGWHSDEERRLKTEAEEAERRSAAEESRRDAEIQARVDAAVQRALEARAGGEPPPPDQEHQGQQQ